MPIFSVHSLLAMQGLWQCGKHKLVAASGVLRHLAVPYRQDLPGLANPLREPFTKVSGNHSQVKGAKKTRTEWPDSIDSIRRHPFLRPRLFETNSPCESLHEVFPAAYAAVFCWHPQQPVLCQRLAKPLGSSCFFLVGDRAFGHTSDSDGTWAKIATS